MKTNKFDLFRELLLEELSPVKVLIVFELQLIATWASPVAQQ